MLSASLVLNPPSRMFCWAVSNHRILFAARFVFRKVSVLYIHNNVIRLLAHCVNQHVYTVLGSFHSACQALACGFMKSFKSLYPLWPVLWFEWKLVEGNYCGLQLVEYSTLFGYQRLIHQRLLLLCSANVGRIIIMLVVWHVFVKFSLFVSICVFPRSRLTSTVEPIAYAPFYS